MSSTAEPVRRRPRGEIDRNYFIGDTLIQTGEGVAIAIVVIALYTPFSLQDALREGMVEYLSIMTIFGACGLGCLLFGRHLRRAASHWDRD